MYHPDGRRSAYPFVVRLPVRVVEQEELQLGRRLGDEAVFGEPLDLASEHRPRRLSDGHCCRRRR